jgi:hypothetical protein
VLMRAPGTSSYAVASAIQVCLAPTTFPSTSRNTNLRISNFLIKSLVSLRSLSRLSHSSCRIFPCDRLHRPRHSFLAGQNTRRLQVAIALSLRHMHSLTVAGHSYYYNAETKKSTYARPTADFPHHHQPTPPAAPECLHPSAIGAGHDICKRAKTVSTQWRAAPIKRWSPRRHARRTE